MRRFRPKLRLYLNIAFVIAAALSADVFAQTTTTGCDSNVPMVRVLGSEPGGTGIYGRARMYRSGSESAIARGYYDIGPAKVAFTIRSRRTGRIVFRGNTDANGAFLVRLRPGTYVLEASPLTSPTCLGGKPACTPRPKTITVAPRHFSYAQLGYIFDCTPVATISIPPQ